MDENEPVKHRLPIVEDDTERIDADIPTYPDDYPDEDVTPRRRLPHRAVYAGLAAGVLALALNVGVWAHEATALADEAGAAAASCQAAQRDAQAVSGSASKTLSEIGDDAVADPRTRTALSDAMKALDDARDDDPTEPEASPDLWRVDDTRIANNRLATGIKASTDAVEKAEKAVRDSKHRHDLDVAKKALSDAVTAARTKVDQTSGKVADNATRTALAQACDAAQEVVDDASVDDVKAYGDAKAPIDDASAKVDASVEAKRRADEEAALAAARARSVSENGARTVAASASSGTWNVSYRNEYGTRAAASDGAVTQWADGYFIAHNWSANGKRIASKPGHVVVNGRSYHYVGAREVPRDSYYEDYEGWVHAGGGIGFQTCISGGGYLVTRYDPD